MSPTSYRTAPPRVMVLDALTAPPETLEFTTLSLKSKGRRAEAPLRRWRLGVPNDEELLARLHHAELAAGDVLDGAGVFTQQFDVLLQALVLALQPGQRTPERLKFLPGFEVLHQPLLADECIEEEQAAEEDQSVLHHTAATLPRGSGVGRGRCGYAGLLHVVDRSPWENIAV